jgi:exonuclease SbcC
MLQKVILENFQAHEHSIINFTEGINVICGASDQGKSSVIRAIRWVLENRPSGFSFKREGATESTRVTLVFKTATIVKERSETENCYKIYKDGQKKPIVLKAIRSDVPDEVKEISGFGQYNIQSQFGQAFLIDDSAGEVAKKINTLSGVSIIDDILKETNSRLRAEKAKETATKELLAKISKDKLAFRNLKRVEKQFKTITTIHKEAEEYKEFYGTLQGLVENLKILNEKPVVDIDSVEDIFKSLRENVDSYTEYKEVSGILKSHVSNLNNAEKKLEAYQELPAVSSALKQARKALPKLVELQNRAAQIKTNIAKLKKFDADWKVSVQNAKTAIDNFAKFKKENKTCPVCNKTW